jgi:lipopolysaccharide export system permease protein
LILERYIIREILAPLAAIGLVLITIFSGYSATHFLNDAVNGLLSGQTVAVLVLLKVLIALEILLPVTLYLAIVLALSRLYADSEVIAMEASGIGPGRIIKSVFCLALPLALLVGALSHYARPWAYERLYALEAGARKGEEFDFAKVEAGRFYELGEDLVFFAEKLDQDGKQARNVHVWKLKPDGREVTFAETARQESGSGREPKTIMFQNGHHYILNAKTNQDRTLFFTRTVLKLAAGGEAGEYRHKAAPSAILAGSAAPEEIAEFQWRLSTGPATILLALLAIPLSRTAPRRSRYGKATAAIVLFFLYYNLSLIAKTWVEKQVVPPVPGLWWVIFLLGTLVLALVFLPWLRRSRKAGYHPETHRRTV